MDRLVKTEFPINYFKCFNSIYTFTANCVKITAGIFMHLSNTNTVVEFATNETSFSGEASPSGDCRPA